jgi:poly(3-hydroxybutyrate) depolymerase
MALADLALIRIEGGGHCWPACMKKHFFAPFTGRQATGIDFNSIAWEFLSQQGRI